MRTGSIQRRDFITLGSSATVLPLAARAQQPVKSARIGFLGATSYFGLQSRIEALRAGLRDLGYVEGNNLIIEFRWAEGRYERLPGLAAELVRLKVDVLVTHGTVGTLAAKQATTTIPIVTAASGDAVAIGLVASLARPGGNITGSSFFGPEILAKRIELLKEAMPHATQLAYFRNADSPRNAVNLQMMEPTAAALNVKLHQFPVQGPNEFEGAFTAMAKNKIDAVTVAEDAMLLANIGTIVELAAKNRLSLIGDRELVEAGGLMGYGANFSDLYRRAATFVDKILKGTKPADLPVEQATRFEFILNLKTAKALGLDVPTSILLRASEVIE